MLCHFNQSGRGRQSDPLWKFSRTNHTEVKHCFEAKQSHFTHCGKALCSVLQGWIGCCPDFSELQFTHISYPELMGNMLKLQLGSSALQNNSSFLRRVAKPTHFNKIKRKGWISFPVFNNAEHHLFFLYRQEISNKNSNIVKVTCQNAFC